MRLSACLLALFFSAPGFSQKLNKYLIAFQDKKFNEYRLSYPGEFLSPASLNRRVKDGISLDESDLPVSELYIKALKSRGLQIHGVSKWLNAVAVITDSASIKPVSQLPFVQSVEYLGPHLKFRNPPNRPTRSRIPVRSYPKPGGVDNPMGYTVMQNSLLGMPALYAAGIRGRGIRIAVMDGGFQMADSINLFDTVAIQGRLHPVRDFVERDTGLFESTGHGTSVLSVMAGNLPGYFVGTAPDAVYFLIKTEDTGGEFPIEEFNWIMGAEKADSLGADLINASLGYTTFNDDRLSHRYSDLDGKSSVGARGARIAATKGMIICNSAGNEGDGPWHFIGVPSDAPGVIAVGAVSADGSKADFSSFGPTADGRIKPDLVAPGEQVVVSGESDIALGISSGTSIASPMLTGAIASLWSAFPEKSSQQILDAVFRSADQAEFPDNKRGWGLPDMTAAWLDLGEFVSAEATYRFDRSTGELELLDTTDFGDESPQVTIRDAMGRTLSGNSVRIVKNRISRVYISGLDDIQSGVFQVTIRMSRGCEHFVCAW